MSATTLDDELAALAAKRSSGGKPGHAAGGFSWSDKARPPKLPRTLLTIIVIAFMIEVVLELLYLGLVAAVLVLVKKAGGEPTPLASMIYLVILYATPIIQWGRLAVLIPSILAYSIFVYCAARNLDMSRARGMDVSPGWAVGWSFIPFANLGQIFNVMKQIWIASHDPARGAASRPAILVWWWTLWLGGNILGTIGNRLAPSDAALENIPAEGVLDAFLPAFAFATVSCMATLTSCALLMKVTKQVVDAQARNMRDAADGVAPAGQLAPA